MSDLGLTYTQIKAADNTYQYQLEPDLSLLSTFTGINSPQLNYWGKQLIAREVEIEQMRRVSPKIISSNNKLNTSAIFGKTGDGKTKSSESSKKPQQIPNFLQSLVPKAIQTKAPKETVSIFFFFLYFFFVPNSINVHYLKNFMLIFKIYPDLPIIL